MSKDLFKERLGIFRGFGESRFEVVSEVLIPYTTQRHMPLQGGYLIVGTDDFDGQPKGILGRVVRAYPIGDLLGGAGEDYLVDLMRLKQEVPEPVRMSRLRYRVSLRLVGQVRLTKEGLTEFSPSIRSTPHVGAPVGLPADEILRLIAAGTRNLEEKPGAYIGHLAIGDIVFDGRSQWAKRAYPVHFRMESLVGRRSAVFARAGMGKSNFAKVLLTRLYEDSSLSAGTIVIDPEGEYAMANASEPGLLDVPALGGRIALFTDRVDIDSRYQENVAGPCRVDFEQLSPRDVVANAVPAEKQETVFANTLRGLDRGAWSRLVKLLERDKYRSSPADVANIIGRRIQKSDKDVEDVICGAIVNNLVPPILRLHKSGSQMVPEIFRRLGAGGIVILDVSMLSSADAQVLSAWILNEIFRNNQTHYTSVRESASVDKPRKLMPTLAILEEAQYYLSREAMREDSPFVRWFKEGRKYQLGSIIVTQQPSAIGHELISQCDNFFVFHLLSGFDLDSLGRANLHYSQDILTSLASEPIPGNCFFWSSRGHSMVTSTRILEFADVVRQSQRLPQEPMLDISKGRSKAVKGEAKRTLGGKHELVDPFGLLTSIVRETILGNRSVALYPVRKRRLMWEGAAEKDYPAAEAIVATKCYNLRFQVADKIESNSQARENGWVEEILESFGDRRIVREHLLQRVLLTEGFCLGRMIAHDSPQIGKDSKEYYVLVKSNIGNYDQALRKAPVDLDILP
ncbi:MAG: ATP-binding protein [Candidatus Sumerlaeaceae bacterium]|nr:ATP-binding protein [Candidatus Sumerlaeaceae bacterium]